MNVDVSSLDATALTTYTANAEQVTDTVGFLMKIIPTTVFNAFTTGDILQVLLISILFGAGLALMGEKGRSVGNMIEEVGAVLFKIIGFIVRLAPLGVLGAVSFTVGRYGIASLQQLGFLVLLFYAGVFFRICCTWCDPEDGRVQHYKPHQVFPGRIGRRNGNSILG